MRGWILFVVLMLVPVTGATHLSGCPLTSAKPADVNVISYGSTTVNGNTIPGHTYYLEDRNSVLFIPGLGWPIPLHSTVLKYTQLNPSSGGTWLYEESNGVAGLQRGGIGLYGDWFPPGCDQLWTLNDLIDYQTLPGGTGPCLLSDEDPIFDETCGHGPDTLII